MEYAVLPLLNKTVDGIHFNTAYMALIEGSSLKRNCVPLTLTWKKQQVMATPPTLLLWI